MSENKTLIEALRRGGLSEAVNLTKSNPGLAVVASKLVKSNILGSFNKETGPQSSISMGQMAALAKIKQQSIIDNENIFEIFPDIERAKLILVSSVLAPKDMMSQQLNYRIDLPTVNPELLGKVVDVVEDEMETYYKFSDGLEDKVNEAMFVSGAHVTCVLPENMIDDIINNRQISKESVANIGIKNGRPKPLGILGSPIPSNHKRSASIESFNIRRDAYNPEIVLEAGGNKKLQTSIEVYDNPDFLKLPLVLESANKSSIKSLMRANSRVGAGRVVAKESMYDAFYKNGNNSMAQMYLSVDPAFSSRRSVGRPLRLKVPTESVIPVHYPGDPSKHIGYFVLVDPDGYFISRNSRKDHVFNSSGNIMDFTNGNANGGLANNLLNKARSNLQRSDNADVSIDDMTRIFGQIIEENLLSRLKNGMIGGQVEISGNEDIYQTMMARALSNRMTRIVFIPEEITIYHALKYYNNGIGKSYLDNLKIITGLRAILLFAKVTGAAKNAIAVTHVNMTLSDKDPDPARTIATAQNEVLKLRQQYIPLGINTATDLVDWVTRAGFEWSFEGHPGLPDTKFDFESKRIQHDLPDDELDESLRKQSYMYLGLPPEIVDNGFSADFATSVINDNILLARIVSQLQKIINRHNSKEVRVLCTYDTVIRDRIRTVLEENKNLVEATLTDEEARAFSTDPVTFLEDYMDIIIEAVSVELPRPDVGSLNNEKEAFAAYEEALDGALKYYISADTLPEAIIGQFNGNVDAVAAVIKAYKMREWMVNNSYFADLSNISSLDVTNDDSGIDFITNIIQHISGSVTNGLKLFDQLKSLRFAADKDVENLSVDPNAASPDMSSSSSDDSGDGSSDDSGEGDDGSTDASGGDDGLGGDNFDFS